jgi:hypothetical protein
MIAALAAEHERSADAAGPALRCARVQPCSPRRPPRGRLHLSLPEETVTPADGSDEIVGVVRT